MAKRHERRKKARAKINTYYNEFNKACGKYLERMSDKQVTLYDIMQSNEMIHTLMLLERSKPQEIALIETAMRNFCKVLVATNKETLGNE